MKKKIFYILYFISMSLFAQANVSDISSMPGAFSRMGFGARGMGMGNALSAVTEGDLVAYYNPALSVFQQGNSFSSSYSILALDRSLNFIDFTRRFDFGQKTNADGSTSPRSTAGISIGLINAGVSNIDARDDEGTKTGSLSTSENLFFAAIANRISQKLSIGFTFRFYYYKLYQNITSTSMGFDFGALYQYNKSFTVSLMVSDINSKYQWDTGSLYGQDGTISKNYFPPLKKIGFAYKFDEPKIIASVEFENSNYGTNILRGGAEYNIYENFFLRAGFDQLNLSNYDFPVRPSCGFSYFYSLNTVKFGVNYAFVIEPYSSSSQHIVGININF